MIKKYEKRNPFRQMLKKLNVDEFVADTFAVERLQRPTQRKVFRAFILSKEVLLSELSNTDFSLKSSRRSSLKINLPTELKEKWTNDRDLLW